MKRLLLAAFALLPTATMAQTPPPAPAPTFEVRLTEQEIEVIIQLGAVCLRSLAYDCGAAFDIRSKLQQAKQPKAAVPPLQPPEPKK